MIGDELAVFAVLGDPAGKRFVEAPRHARGDAAPAGE
jgi:hypothetical protein